MRKKERNDERERRNQQKQREQQIFLEGLCRYREKGISILIDGRECEPEEYQKIFDLKEDGSFYMGDYIGAETGFLAEIHFDRVYYR